MKPITNNGGVSTILRSNTMASSFILGILFERYRHAAPPSEFGGIGGGNAMMADATVCSSAAIMFAMRPTHSLQILHPSDVISRKTCAWLFPQKEQLPSAIAGLRNPPKLRWSLFCLRLQRRLHDQQRVAGECAPRLPHRYGVKAFAAGQRSYLAVSAESPDDLFNSFERIGHTC